MLRAKRRAKGWSIREAAGACGVDPGTWGDWERGKMILYRTHRALVAEFLRLSDVEVKETMSISWVRLYEGNRTSEKDSIILLMERENRERTQA